MKGAEKGLMRAIRVARGDGRLSKEFTPCDLKVALQGEGFKCSTLGSFLPKHEVTKLGRDTKHFERVGKRWSRPALYRLLKE